MSIELTKEAEEVVSRWIREGRFQNASEAIHEAVKQLEVEAGDRWPFPISARIVAPPLH